MKSVYSLLLAGLGLVLLTGCSPDVGSEKWCTVLKEKPRGEWTINETTDYAKYCLFK